MRDEFGFEAIRSVEFCVSVKEDHEQQNYLVPSDRHVQDALRAMLDATVRQLETPDELAAAPEWQQFEVSERYASKEALIAALDSEEMITISTLYDEEGWTINVGALSDPADISYYFAVFRDDAERKLLGVRRAAQFKGVVKSRLIRLVDDSLTMVGDHVFKLDNEFDFLVTQTHVYILHPVGFERVAEIEELVSAKAREKALAIGQQVRFADFTGIAEFVARHKRAARVVVALTSRAGLGQITRGKFMAAARETDVALVNNGRKIGPAAGSEMAFLELLDDRRYTIAIKTGPKEAFVASSRRPVRAPA